MNLDITIEKVDDSVVGPLGEKNTLQLRSDGVMLNSELHFWEDILWVNITNREAIQRLEK